jgi:glyoxylase-like metal-dependent hydrolase (beta-lactamase superfamily II)
VLVDAGWKPDAPRIEAAARALLGHGTPPAAIVLTHVHPDHAGSARVLAETWGCRILVHSAEVGIASGDFAAMMRYAGPLDRWMVLPAMRAIGSRRRATILARESLSELIQELQPGGGIPGLEGWAWVHTPGHTPGHVALVREADRVVLTGDALVSLRVNTAAGILFGRQGLSAPPWYTTWDGRAARASMAMIAALEPRVLGPGHGWPVGGTDTLAAVRAFASLTATEGTASVGPGYPHL